MDAELEAAWAERGIKLHTNPARAEEDGDDEDTPDYECALMRSSRDEILAIAEELSR